MPPSWREMKCTKEGPISIGFWKKVIDNQSSSVSDGAGWTVKFSYRFGRLYICNSELRWLPLCKMEWEFVPPETHSTVGFVRREAENRLENDRLHSRLLVYEGWVTGEFGIVLTHRMEIMVFCKNWSPSCKIQFRVVCMLQEWLHSGLIWSSLVSCCLVQKPNLKQWPLIIWPNRGRRREWQRLSSYWFSPQMPTTDSYGPGQAKCRGLPGLSYAASQGERKQ